MADCIRTPASISLRSMTALLRGEIKVVKWDCNEVKGIYLNFYKYHPTVLAFAKPPACLKMASLKAVLVIAALAFVCQATANTGRRLQQDPVSNKGYQLMR